VLEQALLSTREELERYKQIAEPDGSSWYGHTEGYKVNMELVGLAIKVECGVACDKITFLFTRLIFCEPDFLSFRAKREGSPSLLFERFWPPRFASPRPSDGEQLSRSPFLAIWRRLYLAPYCACACGSGTMTTVTSRTTARTLEFARSIPFARLRLSRRAVAAMPTILSTTHPTRSRTQSR
jgi:hypothetical protein